MKTIIIKTFKLFIIIQNWNFLINNAVTTILLILKQVTQAKPMATF